MQYRLRPVLHFYKSIIVMINNMKIFGIPALLVLLLSSCQDNDSIDTEHPVIDLTFNEAFPKQCDVLQKGESVIMKARFTDNVQLGAFSLDVHQNFDHHSHSTEINDCVMEAVKTPVKPFLLIRNYTIPDGLREYIAEVEIQVPGDVDSGDYHFMILLTDREGWQTIRGISIKVE